MPPAHLSPNAADPSVIVWLRNKLLAGLAVALPLLITVWLLHTVYQLLHGWSLPLLNFFAQVVNELAGYVVLDPNGPIFGLFVQFVGFLIPLMALIGLGVMATNVIGVRVVGAIDALLLRIPVASFVYRSLKQVIDGFKDIGARQNFKRVVYVDYPDKGMKLLGFVTGQYWDSKKEEEMAAVFVPGALSPMTGLLLVTPAAELIDAPLSVEDAMKLIFSGGLIVPLGRRQAAVVTAPAAEPAPAASPYIVEPALPAGLPRAEDFDSGDPDILSGTELEGAQLAGGRRLFDGWGWRRRAAGH